MTDLTDQHIQRLTAVAHTVAEQLELQYGLAMRDILFLAMFDRIMLANGTMEGFTHATTMIVAGMRAANVLDLAEARVGVPLGGLVAGSA